MSGALAQPRTGFKFMITVREGPDVGATFQLLPPRVTIGRGADCNVIFNDPRMSRNAAMIEFSMERISLTETSGRQAMQVNGQFLEAASIIDGDVIRIGDTEFKFLVEAIPLVPSLSPQSMSPQSISPNFPAPQGMAPGFNQNPQQSHGLRSNADPTSEGLSGKQKFYGILVIAGILFFWLLNSGNKQKGAEKTLRTTEEIQDEIKASEVRQEDLAKARIFKTPEEKTRYEEANRHFLEGFRDYQRSQWVRAMRSFETARTIDPQHALAGRYFKLAEKRRDELISVLTLEGRRYYEKNMFARCSAQFEKVLGMIQNEGDLKYQSAMALKKECDLQLQAAKSW
jgi:pSer/pThr/pTyr-binding forkhead associated (FHA) protein